MNRKNQNIEKMFGRGYRPTEPCEWIDTYNKTVIKGGVCGTILTGISFRNMHYVILEI